MKRLLGVTLLALTACVTEPRVDWPINTAAFSVSATYATYWSQVEQCSGITADFSRVAWFRADSTLAMDGGLGAPPWGFTDWRSHRIALDGRIVRHEADSVVSFQPVPAAAIRHEMLHELLQRDGHPEEYFGVGGKCFAEISH